MKYNFRRIALLTIIIAGVALTWYLFSPQPAKEANISQISGSGAANLYFEPEIASVSANITTTLNLMVNSSGPGLLGAQVVLTYSSNCQTPTVSIGKFFPGVIKAPVVANGTISFAYGTGPTVGSSIGGGSVATITTGPTTGTCWIGFQDVQIAGIATGNLLGSVSSGAVYIEGAEPDPEPSPSPLPSVSPSPSPRPSISPCPKFCFRSRCIQLPCRVK